VLEAWEGREFGCRVRGAGACMCGWECGDCTFFCWGMCRYGEGLIWSNVENLEFELVSRVSDGSRKSITTLFRERLFLG
jgi:hypothetical protein